MDLLLESFADLFDVTYTARMESELDDIEEGKIDWHVSMGEFYERFEKAWIMPERHMTDIKRMERPTDLICDKCGKPMVISGASTEASSPAPATPIAKTPRELTVESAGISTRPI